MNNIDFKQILKMSIWTIVSAVLQALALSNFSVPAKIYPSGIMGFTRLISDTLSDYGNIDFPYFYLYILINIILAIIVYKHIGKLFTIFSLIQTILVSLLASIFRQYIILDDRLLIAIFGGLVNGAGAGVALQNGASSGGTDFLSVYYSNKYHRSMWNYVLIFNMVLIFFTGILYGFEAAAYSIVYQYMSNSIVQKMHKRYTHEAIFIVTKRPKEVIDSILNNVRHGITKIDAKGAYKNEDETLLYTVVNSFETSEVVKYALQGDSNAFIETRDVSSVYGNYYQKPLD